MFYEWLAFKTLCYSPTLQTFLQIYLLLHVHFENFLSVISVTKIILLVQLFIYIKVPSYFKMTGRWKKNPFQQPVCIFRCTVPLDRYSQVSPRLSLLSSVSPSLWAKGRLSVCQDELTDEGPWGTAAPQRLTVPK